LLQDNGGGGEPVVQVDTECLSWIKTKLQLVRLTAWVDNSSQQHCHTRSSPLSTTGLPPPPQTLVAVGAG
jgi:hypothetical protein